MMQQRERTEWLNTWISDANTTNRRILLVGDSVTRNIRGKLETLAGKDAAIDLYAASYSLLDDRFETSFDDFLHGNEYKYDAIVINYGYHHGFIVLCNEDAKVADKYETSYRKLIEKCTAISDQVILATGTDYIVRDKTITGDKDYKSELNFRNEMTRKLADVYKLELLDMDEYIKTTGNKLWYEDEVHPEPAFSFAMAFLILKKVFGKLEISYDENQKFAIMANEIGTTKAAVLMPGSNAKTSTKFALKWRKLVNKFAVCWFVLARKMINQ